MYSYRSRIKRLKAKIKLLKEKLEPDQRSLFVRAIIFSKLGVLKPIVKPGISIYERIFMTVIAVCFIYHAVVLIGGCMYKFINEPIFYVDFGDITIINVPFPAMTVCALHLFKLSKLNEAFRLYDTATYHGNATDAKGENWTEEEVSKLLKMIDHICELATSFGKQMGASDIDKSPNLQKFPNWFEHQYTKMFDNPKDALYTQKIVPFIQEGLINCSKVIASCLWQGNPKNCQKLFVPTPTEVGPCCSFNIVQNEELQRNKGLQWQLSRNGFNFNLAPEVPEWEKWNIDNHIFIPPIQTMLGNLEYEKRVAEAIVGSYATQKGPQQQKLAKQQTGLSFILINDEEDDEKACPLRDGIGHAIVIGSPIDDPQVLTNSFYVAPNQEYFIELSASLLFSREKLRAVHPDTRKCYYQGENPLQFYSQYTAGNCRKNCLAMIIQEKCNCLKLSMTTGRNESICGPADQMCVGEILGDFAIIGFQTMCSKFKTCHPRCTQIKYGKSITSIPLSKKKFDHPDKLNLSSNQDFSLIHVYFGSETIHGQERRKQFDLEDQIGLIGGILGLCIGVDYTGVIHFFKGLIFLIIGLVKIFYNKIIGFGPRRYTQCLEVIRRPNRVSENLRMRRRNRRGRNRVVPVPRVVILVQPANENVVIPLHI